jgi:translation elongation factor EF-1alpha
LVSNTPFDATSTHPQVQVGELIMVSPSKVTCHVKSIVVRGMPVLWAVAGQRADVVVANIDPESALVGSVISAASDPVPLVTKLRAKLIVSRWYHSL